MKRLVLATSAVLAFSAATAMAADMPMVRKAPVVAPAVPAFDIAFGGAVMSDYNFRGISQSDRGPSATAYFEPRYNINPNLQLYVGLAGSAVKLPTDPSAEIDFYAGVRPTFGALALDLGFIYYYYPKERILFDNLGAQWTKSDTDYWEVYAKGTYTFNDYVAVGANLYYSPSWLNTGAPGTYLSGTVKLTAPSAWFPKDVGASLSGELGRYWLGTVDPILGSIDLPDYTYWNAGVAFTYKAITLDLRYHDTDRSKADCFILSTDPAGIPGGATPGESKWCGAAFIAKLAFDTTLNALK